MQWLDFKKHRTDNNWDVTGKENLYEKSCQRLLDSNGLMPKRKMRLKKRHNYDMIFNEKVDDLLGW